VVSPNSVKFFGTRGLVKVIGTIDRHLFKSSFMAMGDGRHMLPVKVEIHRAIGKRSGRNSEGATGKADTQLRRDLSGNAATHPLPLDVL
jgi:hypothetical protein